LGQFFWRTTCNSVQLLIPFVWHRFGNSAAARHGAGAADNLSDEDSDAVIHDIPNVWLEGYAAMLE
jgi:hypothetical protein